MKKAMNQSLMTLILNGVSILALVFSVLSLFSYGYVSSELNDANEERFLLTYNANRFMNGSAYLTNEVRAYAATGFTEHYDNHWRCRHAGYRYYAGGTGDDRCHVRPFQRTGAVGR